MYSKLEIKKDEIIVQTGDNEFHPSTVSINGRCYFRDLPEHLKPPIKKPILTTDDGVDMYDGKMWLLSTLGWGITNVHICSQPFRGVAGNEFKYFSTKQTAQEYKLMYCPCLCLKDVEDYLNTVKTYSPTWSYIKELKETVKLKTDSADR